MSTSIFLDENAMLGKDVDAARMNLNAKLKTEYIDVPPEDTSTAAMVTRTITARVGEHLTPRQMVVALRVLKAITFVFLCLTVIADLMYIFFAELKASHETNVKLGGLRDLMVRIFGLAVALVAISIEIDRPVAISTRFEGFKPFLARSCLIAFVAVLTATPPVIAYEKKLNARSNKSNSNGSSYSYDDNYSQYSYGGGSSSSSSSSSFSDIPSSAVAFQSVTSWVL